MERTPLRCSRTSPPRSPFPPPDLLESRWFLHEASLAQKFFLLWFVGLVARLKY